MFNTTVYILCNQIYKLLAYCLLVNSSQQIEFSTCDLLYTMEENSHVCLRYPVFLGACLIISIASHFSLVPKWPLPYTSPVMWPPQLLVQQGLAVYIISCSKNKSEAWAKLWHHHLNGHEFERTLENSDGQGSLVFYRPRVAKSRTQLSDWTTNTVFMNTKYFLFWKVFLRTSVYLFI